MKQTADFFKKVDSIINSSLRISLVLLAIVSIYSLNLVKGTNSFYSDVGASTDNSITAGYWIPEINYSISPSSSDGENDWYVTRPCVTLTANIHGSTDNITIYYKYSNDGNPVSGGQVYEGSCLNISDGDWNFEAQAVNNENPADWRSEVITKQIKVDTKAPDIPKWDSPANNIFTHQDNDVKIKWHSDDTTSGIAGYKYISDYPGGEWDSFSYCHELLIDSKIPSSQIGPGGSCINGHEATLGRDGNYKRKVRAVDSAGNISDWSSVWEMNRDTTRPESEVDSASKDPDNSLKAHVAFHASDDFSGVKEIEIFYRKDGGSWSSLGKYEESDSPITFTADSAGEYSFYSIAEDKADDLDASDMADGSNGDNGNGNIESKDPLIEATVVLEELADPDPCADGSCGPSPMMVGGSFMSLTVSSPEDNDQNENSNTNGDEGRTNEGNGEEGENNNTNLNSSNNTVSPASLKAPKKNIDKKSKKKKKVKETSSQNNNEEDNNAPTSRIKKIKKREGTSGRFKFTLSARDDNSGTDKVTIYYRKDNNDWDKLGDTENEVYKNSEKLKKGVYEFYTIATDKAGNEEEKNNPKPEARITITDKKTTIEIIDIKKSKTKKSKVKKTKADKKNNDADKKDKKYKKKKK